MYLSPLILKLHVPSSVSLTHSTKLDSRKQWQFYLHLYLFIIASGTFWKFNNVCVQLNAAHIFFSFVSEDFLPWLLFMKGFCDGYVMLSYFLWVVFFVFWCLFLVLGHLTVLPRFQEVKSFVGNPLFHG